MTSAPDGGLPVMEIEQSAEPFATNEATDPAYAFLFSRARAYPIELPVLPDFGHHFAQAGSAASTGGCVGAGP